MKATLTFQLPEQSEEHCNALNGTSFKGEIYSFDYYLKSLASHGPSEETIKNFRSHLPRSADNDIAVLMASANFLQGVLKQYCKKAFNNEV